MQDNGVTFGRKQQKKQKFSKIFFWNFLKMVNGRPGPGPAAGTVFRSKLESQDIEFIFSK